MFGQFVQKVGAATPKPGNDFLARELWGGGFDVFFFICCCQSCFVRLLSHPQKETAFLASLKRALPVLFLGVLGFAGQPRLHYHDGRASRLFDPTLSACPLLIVWVFVGLRLQPKAAAVFGRNMFIWRGCATSLLVFCKAFWTSLGRHRPTDATHATAQAFVDETVSFVQPTCCN